MQRSKSSLILTAMVFSAIGWTCWPMSVAREVRAVQKEVRAPALQFQGAASCASMACHNGNGPKGSKNTEYSTWASCDPHAMAYDALLGERSRRMQAELNRHVAPERRTSAQENTLCLGCHAMFVGDSPYPSPQGGREEQRGKREAMLTFGVGCESCHGAAEKWLTKHYADGWKDRQDKEALGFRNTKNLSVRAAVCAECHVGSPQKDVNHDLIATGHPRLHFEFGAYLANLPKHWDAAKERDRYPDFEARAWALGQLTSLAAAMRLLEARARRAGGAPWPEFAEHDCFACHHDLAPHGWQHGPNSRDKLGLIPATYWYSALEPYLTAKLSPDLRQGTETSLVRDLRLALCQRVPEPDDVARLAAGAATCIERLLPILDNDAFDRSTIANMINDLMDEDRFGTSWDALAQRFLGVQALRQSLGEMDPGYSSPEVEKWLRAMGPRLEFPPHYDSPHGFNAGTPKSNPAEY